MWALKPHKNLIFLPIQDWNQQKIDVFLSRSQSSPSVYESIEDGRKESKTVLKDDLCQSERPSLSPAENASVNLSDLTSVFTHETDADQTVIPGQVGEDQQDFQDLLIREKVVQELPIDHNKRKRHWWKQICLLCMSRQF